MFLLRIIQANQPTDEIFITAEYVNCEKNLMETAHP